MNHVNRSILVQVRYYLDEATGWGLEISELNKQLETAGQKARQAKAVKDFSRPAGKLRPWVHGQTLKECCGFSLEELKDGRIGYEEFQVRMKEELIGEKYLLASVFSLVVCFASVLKAHKCNSMPFGINMAFGKVVKKLRTLATTNELDKTCEDKGKMIITEAEVNSQVAQFLRVNPDAGLFFFVSSYRPVPLAQQYIGITEPNFQARNELRNEICYRKVVVSIKQGHQLMVFVHSRKDTGKTADKLVTSFL
ncbi:hypothetical protein Tco_1144819, partial [Tanacetum coccineum]